MTTQYWFVKQEPSDYAWPDLVRDGRTAWTGVRNPAARNHLRAMAVGDAVLVYHTGEEKAVVGRARVVRAAYPDPTADGAGWVAVDLAPVGSLPRPVPLATIKAEALLRSIALVRQPRLSVAPLRGPEFTRLLRLGGA